MGITLKELQNKLMGELDVIPAASLKDRINDALRDIYDEEEWGFLFTDAFIKTPAIIEGTANVTTFSDLMIVDAATKAIIDAITVDDVPFGDRQIRVIGTNRIDRGFVYDILDYDSTTGAIRTHPAYQDVSNTAVKIQILKIYYTPPYYQTARMGLDENDNNVVIYSDPIIDFKRFEYIVSPQFNRRLIIDATPAEIHRFDPYREFASEPRYMVSAPANIFGVPRYELYPAPRFDRVLRVKYLRAGQPLVNLNDEAPDLFTKDLIITKAKITSYEWAVANADKLKLKTVGRFANLIAFADRKYQTLLAQAKKKDEESYPKAYQGNVIDIPYWDSELNGECLGETLLLNF